MFMSDIAMLLNCSTAIRNQSLQYWPLSFIAIEHLACGAAIYNVRIKSISHRKVGVGIDVNQVIFM
jgi:hypothetical protein